MQNVKFFQNLGAVLILAFVNTVLTALFVGLLLFIATYLGIIRSFSMINCLLFGSIISATDTISVLTLFTSLGVDDTLYALIFGESMFNDAVAMVLYKSLLAFQYISFTLESLFDGLYNFFSVFLGSLSCGIVVGVFASLFLKYTNLSKPENKDIERALLLLIPFVCYLFADGCNMSGIVAMLFCGIVMSWYASHNMSPKRYLSLFLICFFLRFFNIKSIIVISLEGYIVYYQ